MGISRATHSLIPRELNSNEILPSIPHAPWHFPQGKTAWIYFEKFFSSLDLLDLLVVIGEIETADGFKKHGRTWG
jgi:hypothetical protein